MRNWSLPKNLLSPLKISSDSRGTVELGRGWSTWGGLSLHSLLPLVYMTAEVSAVYKGLDCWIGTLQKNEGKGEEKASSNWPPFPSVETLVLDLTEPKQYFWFVGGLLFCFCLAASTPSKREKQKEQKRVQKEKELADQVIFPNRSYLFIPSLRYQF